MKRSASNGILSLFDHDKSRVIGSMNHARQVEIDNMQQRQDKMSMSQFEKKTNLDMEKMVVKHQQQAQIDHYNEEKKQKEMKRV